MKLCSFSAVDNRGACWPAEGDLPRAETRTASSSSQVSRCGHYRRFRASRLGWSAGTSSHFSTALAATGGASKARGIVLGPFLKGPPGDLSLRCYGASERSVRYCDVADAHRAPAIPRSEE